MRIVRSVEVNECMKHMLLNDILQLVVLLDNYTTRGMFPRSTSPHLAFKKIGFWYSMVQS